MIPYAILAFAVAAAGGLVMALRLVRARLAPWPLSLLHGGLGALGLALLIGVLVQGGAPAAVTWALAILVVAALGGFFLASFHLRGTLPPRAIVAVHAGVAVAGVLTLLGAVL